MSKALSAARGGACAHADDLETYVPVPEIANTLGGASQSGGFRTTDLDNQGAFIPSVANPLTHRMHKGVNTTADEGQTMIAQAFKPSHYTRGKDGAPSDIAAPLQVEADKGDQDPVVLASTFDWQQGGAPSNSLRLWEEQAGTVEANRTQAVLAFTAKDSGQDAQPEISPTLRGISEVKGNANAGGQVAIAFESRYARNGRGAPDVIVPPLKAQSGETGKGDGAPLVALPFDTTQLTHPANRSNPKDGDPAGTLAKDGHPPSVALLSSEEDVADPIAANVARTYTQEGEHNSRLTNVAMSNWMVRRLTPTECERLQGFPDCWTDVPYRGKPAADGPRYKALGNSMAVPCMRWLGQRIALYMEGA